MRSVDHGASRRVIDVKLIETKLDLFTQNAIPRYNQLGRGAQSILAVSIIGDPTRVAIAVGH
jgi:hypothetical protein